LLNYQNIPFLFLDVPIRSTRLVTQISTFVVSGCCFHCLLPPHLLDFALWRGSDNGGDALAAS
jgi:hypothetical protein